MAEALRDNQGKPKLSYFIRSFPRMVEAIARVKEMGGIKYEEGNWKKGGKPDEEYWDSLSRHLNYIFCGEKYDKDTGCLHIAHAVWNLCALHELNSDLPAIDEEMFAERAAHWRKVRAEREAKEAKTQAAFAGIFVSGEKVADIEKWDATFIPDEAEPEVDALASVPDSYDLGCQGFCPDCTCKEECMDETKDEIKLDDLAQTLAENERRMEDCVEVHVPKGLLPEETQRHVAFEIKDAIKGERSELFTELISKIADQHARNVIAADRRQREADARLGEAWDALHAQTPWAASLAQHVREREAIEAHIKRCRGASAAEEES